MNATFAAGPPGGRRLRSATAALLVAVSAVATGCTAVGSTSAPRDVPRDRHEFSADGVAWGGAGLIPWDLETIPVPGSQPNATTFHLRVSGETAVTAEVYLGNWSVQRGTAWFRADIDGVPGERVTLPGPAAAGPGFLVSEFPIAAGDSVKLTLNVGVPYAETEQSVRIDPDWGVVLREAGGGEGGGGGGGTGSIGSGSLGSGGSFAGSSAGSSGQVGSSVSGSSGSAGSSAGSSMSFGSLGGPLVPGG